MKIEGSSALMTGANRGGRVPLSYAADLRLARPRSVWPRAITEAQQQELRRSAWKCSRGIPCISDAGMARGLPRGKLSPHGVVR